MTAPPAVERRFRVVGFWRRTLAAMIDLGILVPFLILFAVVVATVGGREPRGLRELGPTYIVDLVLDGGTAGVAVLLMVLIVSYLYFFIFHALRGRTPGQGLLRAQVIDSYGVTPSVPRVLVRTFGLFLSLALFSVGLLWIGFDRERRALHDWIAGTYVVAVPRSGVTEVASGAVT